MAYTKRLDGRKFDEMRKIEAEVGIVKNADGSAMFRFGDTVAIATVYGPRPLHPQHLQDPKQGVLRCTYNMLSFSVDERIRPGPSRRSQEISKVTEWALSPVVELKDYPSTVTDVFVTILQANASTRCAGINAASLALAHAGLTMKNLVTSVSIGKIDDKIVIDLIKKEEDYEEGEGATDIPVAFLGNTSKLSLLQLDGKTSPEKLKEAIEAGEKACKEVYEVQKNVLKSLNNGK